MKIRKKLYDDDLLYVVYDSKEDRTIVYSENTYMFYFIKGKLNKIGNYIDRTDTYLDFDSNDLDEYTNKFREELLKNEGKN